ncbi:MAG: hypothetical protein HGA96_01320 [Desulfobulbaceae bacterium]|nr:hypothetical protein [Desulfobulbaceae bacterium]
MNFFCWKKHYEEWSAAHSRAHTGTFCLDLAEGVSVARRLFGPRS